MKTEGGLLLWLCPPDLSYTFRHSDILINSFIDYPLIALNFLEPPPTHRHTHTQTLIHSRIEHVLHSLALLTHYKAVSETEDDNLWFLAVARWTGHRRIVTLS